MKAIRIHSHGGPEVLQYEDAPAPAPGKNEALVKIGAAGVNFIDIYFRTGVYKAAQMPFTPGHEAAGTVTAVGDDVSEVKVGDQVSVRREAVTRTVIVKGLSGMRGPAPVAQQLYEETAESTAARWSSLGNTAA